MTPGSALSIPAHAVPNVHDPETLHRAGWISAEEYAGTVHEMKRGASAISALSLNTQDKLLWAKVAAAHSLRYYTEHTELRVLSTDLLQPEQVLASGILPHRTRGAVLQGVTYDPAQIMPHHPLFPGTLLDAALVAPSTWRHLYDLAYPHELVGSLSDAQMRALISLTPTDSGHSLSPEQHAEWQAVRLNLRYIDVRRDPPDAEVSDMISPALKRIYNAYPHHLEGTSLVIITPHPDNRAVLEALESVTQRPVIACVTTQDTINHLLRNDDLHIDAKSVDDGLDRLTPFLEGL